MTSLAIEKCIRLFVLIAGMNAKFHSNQQKADQFFVKIALETRDDSDSRSSNY